MPDNSTEASSGADVQRREQDVKLKELELREREADKASILAVAPWWRRADPLVIALIGGILALIGNMGVAVYNNNTTTAQEEQKNKNALAQQDAKARADLALETLKARYTLILQAIATADPAVAERNINFFIDAGLLEDTDRRISTALAKFKPVLPSPSGGTTGIAQVLAVPEIGRVYNFPDGLDGSGQTIGVLEFGGGYRPADISAYFGAAKIPRPEITDVSVDGAINDPNVDPSINGQVTLDIEIIGALAPKASIRVYFARFGERGFIDAINRAMADHVSVLSIGWGQAESGWSEPVMKRIDEVLRVAAQKGMTVVAAAGDQGVTDGVKDGRPHVDFPASSPWVLAVGGTEVTSGSHRLVAEVAWNDHDASFAAATGGGVSDVFGKPDWQASVTVPQRKDGTAGRGVPDVAATASPKSGALLLIGGKAAQIGGTSVSAPVWAALIALINQGLGRNVGHFNPLLYGEIGPAGVLHAITKGDNSVGTVKGYSAGPGWNAVAGWGSPDGTKLLEWLRAHQ